MYLDFDELDQEEAAVHQHQHQQHQQEVHPELQGLWGSLDGSEIETVDTSGRRLRVFTISDCHIDSAPNRAWLEAHCPKPDCGCFHVLVLPGDLTDELGLLDATLRGLSAVFDLVAFTPGNHELWCLRGKATDSVQKLRQVIQLCENTGVRTRPVRLVGGAQPVLISPLFSWYSASWDNEPDLPYSVPGDLSERWTDCHAVRWPVEWGSDPDLPEILSTINAPWLVDLAERAAGEILITFSHFLPRQELFPEKR